MRRGLIAALGVALLAPAAEAAEFVVINRASIHRSASFSSESVQTAGFVVLRVRQRQGDWLRVETVTGTAGHCVGESYALELAGFVRASDAQRVLTRAGTWTFTDGSSIRLAAGSPASWVPPGTKGPRPKTARRYRKVGAVPAVRLTHRLRDRGSLAVGDRSIDLEPSDGLQRIRDQRGRTLARINRRCVQYTGWIDSDKLAADAPGGVLGGVLGSAPGAHLAAKAVVYWPRTSKRAGIAVRRIPLDGPAEKRGGLSCAPLRTELAGTATWCFKPERIEGGAAVGTPPRPPEPAVSGPAVVPWSAFEAHRTSGTAKPTPARETREAIREANRNVVGVWKLCVTGAGRPETVAALKRTGFPDLDARIAKAIWGWRFRPFEIDGKPTAACSSVVMIYRPGDV